jgi:AcrR family transcriptional regulator
MTLPPTLHSFPLQPKDAPTRKERADATENRERVLLAAQALFAKHGVAAVSMSDIVELAGVGKGTLYRRFSNKGELCLTLLNEAFQQFQDEALERMRVQTAQGMNYLTQLSEFLAELVLFVVENLPLLQEAQAGAVKEAAERMNRPHFWQYLTIRGLLQQALKAGEIAPDIDPYVQASLLLAPLQANYLQFQLSMGISAEQVALNLQRLAFGLRA